MEKYFEFLFAKYNLTQFIYVLTHVNFNSEESGMSIFQKSLEDEKKLANGKHRTS